MAQIKKGFIAPNAIDGSKLRLLNNEAIRALAADGSDVELMKIDLDSVLQFLRVPQVSSDPASGNDLARKSYTDNYTDTAVAAEAAARQADFETLEQYVDSLSLDRLTDVTMSNPDSGDVLRYDGSQWTKEAPVDSASSGNGGSGLDQIIAPTALNLFTAVTAAGQIALLNGNEELANFTISTSSPGVGLVTWTSPTAGKDSAALAALDTVNFSGAQLNTSVFVQDPITGGATSWDAVMYVTAANPMAGGFLIDLNQSQLVRTEFSGGQFAPSVSLTPEEFTSEASPVWGTLFYQVPVPQGSYLIALTDQGYQNVINFDLVQANDYLTVKKVITAGADSNQHWKFQVSETYKRGPTNPYDMQWVVGQFVEYYDYGTQTSSNVMPESWQGQILDFGDDFIALEYKVERTGSAPVVVSSAGKLIKSNADGKLDQSFLQYNINFGDNVLSGVSAPTTGTDAANKTWVEVQVANEQAARESADAGLQSQIDALSGNSSAGLAQEISDRQAADAGLQSQIDTEKGRIDAILSASDADKDSFAEIVALINSVDTTNDQAFASYVLSNDAALAQEVSDRQAGDEGLQDALDQEISDRQAAVSSEESARIAADNELQDNIDAEEAARIAAVSAEESARIAGDSDLQDAIDQEVSDRQAAVSAEQSAREAADSAEAAARQAADEALDARLDILEADPVTKTYVDGEVSDLQGQIDVLSSSSAGDLASETAARVAADDALDARLDVLEGADTVEGSVAKAEKDAKDHADSIVASEQSAREAADTSLQNQINDILNNTDPAALDSLSEIVSAFQQADSDLTDAITSVLGTHTSELNTEVAAREAADLALQGNIDAEESAREAADEVLQDNIDAEAIARQSADDALDARVDALEAVSEGRAKFVITQADLDNQYLDLSHVAKPDSTFMFYGPLYLHEGDDYTVSTVDGVSRLSFSGRIATGEPSQPIVGDVIYVRYKH